MPASGAGPLFPDPGGGVIALGEQERPLVVLSCATSIDGYLDDTSPRRLVLSTPADLDRVDAVRAASDAIPAGAGAPRAGRGGPRSRGEGGGPARTPRPCSCGPASARSGAPPAACRRTRPRSPS